MRFWVISTQKNWGGGDALLLDISLQLQAAGHQVRWIARRDSEIADHLEANQIQALHYLRGRGTNFQDWFQVRKAMRQWCPDIVVCNDTHAVPIGGVLARMCPNPRPIRLAYKHTVFPLRSAQKYRLLSDKLICVSEAARQTLLDGGMRAADCEVIYGGGVLDASALKPVGTDGDSGFLNADDDVRLVRDELKLEPGQLLLLSIGSLLECKGHRQLIDAVSTWGPQLNLVSVAKESDPLPTATWKVVIAGEGPERDQLQKQIAAAKLEDHVQLLGYREDVSRLMKAADLIVHPSHAEGLSLVLIQAQLFEKPIVATAVGGAAEVIAAGSQECSAWVAKEKDSADLSRKLKAALACVSGDRGELDIALRRMKNRTETLFDIEKNSAQLADLCAQMLQMRKA